MPAAQNVYKHAEDLAFFFWRFADRASQYIYLNN